MEGWENACAHPHGNPRRDSDAPRAGQPKQPPGGLLRSGVRHERGRAPTLAPGETRAAPPFLSCRRRIVTRVQQFVAPQSDFSRDMTAPVSLTVLSIPAGPARRKPLSVPSIGRNLGEVFTALDPLAWCITSFEISVSLYVYTRKSI